jgi:hypothetical protein
MPSASKRRPVLSLPSGYPQPTLSLPPDPIPLDATEAEEWMPPLASLAAISLVASPQLPLVACAPACRSSPRMPLEATQAEALHTCRTVYSLILSCHLLALLLLAVSYLARVSGAKKPGEAQHRRRKDLRPRYAQCEQSSPCAQPTLSLSSAYPQPTL